MGHNTQEIGVRFIGNFQQQLKMTNDMSVRQVSVFTVSKNMLTNFTSKTYEIPENKRNVLSIKQVNE